jgi:hypothetical protein
MENGCYGNVKVECPECGQTMEIPIIKEGLQVVHCDAGAHAFVVDATVSIKANVHSITGSVGTFKA